MKKLLKNKTEASPRVQPSDKWEVLTKAICHFIDEFKKSKKREDRDYYLDLIIGLENIKSELFEVRFEENEK